MKLKLQSKILLVVAPSVILPMLVAAWVAYVQLHQHAEQDLMREVDLVLERISSELRTRINAARANAALFAGADLLERYLLTDSEYERYELMQPALLRLLSSYQAAHPGYYEARVVLTDGFEDLRVTARGLPNQSVYVDDDPIYEAATSQTTDPFAGVYRNPDNGQPSLLVSKRIELAPTDADPTLARPELRGYLMLTASLDFLRQDIEHTRIGASGHLLLVDSTGEQVFPGATPVDSASLGPLMNDLRLAMTQRRLVQARIGEIDSQIHGTPLAKDLYLLALLPDSEFTEPGRRLGAGIAAHAVATVLLVATLLLLVLRALVVNPIAKLTRVTRDIGKGSLHVSLGLDRGDEIGELANAFEEMGRGLQKRGEQVQHLAFHDSLTGLPNRHMFGQFLTTSVARSRSRQQQFALLFLDLDNFKHVNDSLGHHAGDRLLKEITSRIRGCLEKFELLAKREPADNTATVARLGGDEFIVLLPGLTRASEAAQVAELLLAELCKPVQLDGYDFRIGASIGITIYPDDADDAETLVRNADLAMYQAKSGGKNTHRFYAPSMNQRVVERVAMEQALRQALEREELELHYQAQVEPISGTLLGAEALLRWNHPERGPVAPQELIATAEECGLIAPIGEWIVTEACRRNRLWQQRGLPKLAVAVNLSSQQLARGKLDRLIDEALQRAGLAPEFLEIEITESSVMQAEHDIALTLAALKAMGVRISLDDFGTGYSSLSALHRLPIHALKIDRSFVRTVPANRDAVAIATTIIQLAKSLGLQTTAEGVESAEQLTFLRQQGCDRIQGYHVCRPLAAAEFEQFLRREATRTRSAPSLQAS